MASTTEYIERLRAALYSGELSVTFNGRTVTYRSVRELERALAHAQAELDNENGRMTAGPRKFFFATHRGH